MQTSIEHERQNVRDALACRVCVCDVLTLTLSRAPDRARAANAAAAAVKSHLVSAAIVLIVISAGSRNVENAGEGGRSGRQRVSLVIIICCHYRCQLLRLHASNSIPTATPPQSPLWELTDPLAGFRGGPTSKGRVREVEGG